jgi:hypothetical protein
LGSSCILCNVLDVVLVLTLIVLFDAMCYPVALVILAPLIIYWKLQEWLVSKVGAKSSFTRWSTFLSASYFLNSGCFYHSCFLRRVLSRSRQWLDVASINWTPNKWSNLWK